MEEDRKQKEEKLSEEALKEANALQKKAVQKQIQKKRYKRMYAAAYRYNRQERTKCGEIRKGRMYADRQKP